MKRTAFFQALALLILLIGSWSLLLLRFRDTPETPGPTPASLEELPISASPAQATQVPPRDANNENESARVPEGWQDWVDYLGSLDSLPERRAALADLRKALFAMPPQEAITRIVELIESDYDWQTGLRFQVGGKGRLLATGTLRATLLDWLGQLDPELAARIARSEITTKGTALGPDAYVVHLRNFATGTPLSNPGRDLFLKQQFVTLLNHEPWINAAPPAIAEAMDIAVYLQDSALVPPLTALTRQANPIAIRQAAGLAIERLVDIDPAASVQHLIETPLNAGMNPRRRASYVARLDPVGSVELNLLADYLQSPGVSLLEATVFLQFFPNLNRSYSHNLLSPEFPDTGAANHAEHLQRALQSVQDWQRDPRFSRLEQLLDETANRIHLQLYGKPLP